MENDNIIKLAFPKRIYTTNSAMQRIDVFNRITGTEYSIAALNHSNDVSLACDALEIERQLKAKGE